MSKHGVTAGDVAGLMNLFADLRRQAEARTGESYPIIAIQEAGLDGFWLHRVLQQNGIESHVVDPASIATPRRRRRAKTDRLVGETLLRALLAYKRGEPRVCDGSCALARRGGSAADLSRTTELDRRAHHACEPDQGIKRRLERRTRSSQRKCRPEHGQAANRRFLCRFVLDDVPVLGKLAVPEAHDIHHDPVRRQAHA
ncbi:MAG: transposase, partial [Bradyrhizobium sp.]|nr:transposase [Bradyrhizobium sp.]